MSKTCPNCKKIYMKEKKHFNVDKTRKDGLSFYCKYCNRNIVAYYEEKRKAPKIKKICAYSKCNNTFETRMERKRFCCNSCNSKDYQERKGLENTRFRQNFLKKLNRRKELKPNTRKPWSFDEIAILFDMRKEDKKFKEIGKILGRSSEACLNKYFLVKREKETK